MGVILMRVLNGCGHLGGYSMRRAFLVLRKPRVIRWPIVRFLVATSPVCRRC